MNRIAFGGKIKKKIRERERARSRARISTVYYLKGNYVIKDVSITDLTMFT